MRLRLMKPLPLRLSVTGTAWLSFALPPVLAQTQPVSGQPPRSCPPPVVLPCPTAPAKAPADEKPEGKPLEKEPAEEAPIPGLPGEQSAAAGGEAFAYAPNMIGNLLGAGRSVSFFINRTQGAVFVNGLGSTSIVNPKVADDNSPLPRDRVSFRFNHFNDAFAVTGISSAPPVFDPVLGGLKQTTATRSYDVDQYTVSFEKAFLDGLFSTELRLPFSHGLASKLNLSAGQVTGITAPANGMGGFNFPTIVPPGATITPGTGTTGALNVVSTPQNTLGREDTEIGNLSVILKGLVLQRESLAVSVGMGIGIPTAQDTHVRVTDYLGFTATDTTIQRVRDFRVKNEFWSVSPFVAVLATPSDRAFAQGFLQIDVPVSTSEVNYAETIPINVGPPFPPRAGTVMPPFGSTDRLEEQSLLQVDLGVGYWLVRDCSNRWLTGLAPTLELHYTTTLENADIESFPRDSSMRAVRVPSAQFPTGITAEVPSPQVGNFRNRMDILDLTVGATALIGDRATVAAAVAFPLRTGDNRTFDWEFQLQVNYYFGGLARR